MSQAPRVTVVLSYHLRSQNYLAQLAAFRGQSVPVRVAVFHTTRTAAPHRWDADYVVSHSGQPDPKSSGRWAAAVLCATEYVLVQDDDWIPGGAYVERLLEAADGLDGRFGVIGDFGRIARWDGQVPYYDGRQVERGQGDVREVTNVVRSYFFRPFTVGYGARFLWEFGRGITGIHEDMAICLGNRLYGGLATYLMPSSDDSEQSVELPAPEALTWRPEHFEERTTILRRVAEQGLLPKITPDE